MFFSRTSLTQAWQQVADREAANIRDQFMAERHPKQPARTWVALFICVLVVFVYVLLLGFGVFLLLQAVGVFGKLHFITKMLYFIVGLGLVLFAWQAKPYNPKPEGMTVTPDQTPELFALTKDIAQHMQIAPPKQIILDADLNAYMGKFGFPAQATLGIGLPLWYGLHPNERVALIAHELAHLKNGDPARYGLVGTAFKILSNAHANMTPDLLMEINAQNNIFSLLSNWLMRRLAYIPLFITELIAHLIGSQHQHCEFHADLMASEIAGHEATLGMLDKLHYQNALESALHKQKYSPERPHAFLELRHIWDQTTEQQRQQVRQNCAQRRLRLDDSHPPTIDRIQVVGAYPKSPQLPLDAARAARIDAELERFVPQLAQQAFEEYQERYNAY